MAGCHCSYGQLPKVCRSAGKVGAVGYGVRLQPWPGAVQARDKLGHPAAWRGRGQSGTHLRQMTLSWLYLRASTISDGSMMPPRRRRTRCSVDSVSSGRQQGEHSARAVCWKGSPRTLLDVVVC